VIGQLNVSHVTYSNLIRYAVPSPSDVISRTTIYYVPVQCVLPRQSDPTSRIDPTLRTAPPRTGDGQFNVSLILFKDHRFQVGYDCTSASQSGSTAAAPMCATSVVLACYYRMSEICKLSDCSSIAFPILISFHNLSSVATRRPLYGIES